MPRWWGVEAKRQHTHTHSEGDGAVDRSRAAASIIKQAKRGAFDYH